MENVEGRVWESGITCLCSKTKLTIFIDYNKCTTGRSQEIMSLEVLHEKWVSFGYIRN